MSPLGCFGGGVDFCGLGGVCGLGGFGALGGCCGRSR